MVNKVILIGNLGRDPEVRHLESGAAVAKFPIATNESYRDKSGEWKQLTEWHDIVAWRALAERAERSLKKGSLIYVEGKLTHRKWQDKEGIDRYSTEVVANTFRILEKREGSERSSYSDNFPKEEASFVQASDSNSDNSKSADQSLAKEVTEMEDDDLPF